ncbi:MAG: ABC transporter ATP-binding protein [Thiohalocapsa sp.]|jgi:ABC-2 type transport system ATP-binding protein
MLHVASLRKQYPGVEAVRDLTFDVLPGQILGLIGPNGAGKTTTMRAIAGIIAPTSGRIEVDGHDVRREPLEAKKALAYVPDDPALFGSLTVYEHLVLAARAYDVPDFRPEAERLLRRFQLSDLRDTLAQELSRGARQKVAICAAYIHDAKVILFDEPLTGLDPHAIRTMKDSIRERAAAGAAFVISSHLLSLIDDLCTHLLVLHKGQALFAGTVADARSLASRDASAATLEETFFHIVRDAVES